MPKLKQLPLDILKRNQFEDKRSYENAIWYLEHLNDLVMLHNHDYVLFEGDQKFIPDLYAAHYVVEDGPYEVEDESLEDSGIDKTGELKYIGFGAACLIGCTRCLKKGRIFVSKRDAKAHLKGLTVVKKSDFHNFLDL